MQEVMPGEQPVADRYSELKKWLQECLTKLVWC